MIKVNRFKTLYPHLSPAPVHAPETSGATTTVNKVGSFKLEKRRLPKFGGTLREYPTFKKDWQTQVAPNYDDQVQLYELRELVPVKDKIHVEKFSKIAEFWKFMDVKYGNKDKLVRDHLAYLRDYKYKHPKDCRSDAEKFHAMHTRFHEVCSDMEKVDSLHMLEHPAYIQEFMKLLPTEPIIKYVDHRLAKEEGNSELEMVKTFMEAERRRQKAKQQVTGEKIGTQQGPSPTGVAGRKS